MIWIWRYLFGFITIKISGKDSEKFITTASSNGINIWNLCWKDGFIYGNISTNNFLKLFHIRHSARCEVKIIKKYGLFIKTKRYKKRFGLFIGAIVFIFIIYFMSNFIWIININGNKIISTQSIKDNCQKLGITEGVSKNKINSKYDAQRLQLTQDEISWCSFNIEGCILNINITEVPKSDKETRETPCNIKASIDGKITKIDVASGDVKIKVGDVVSKGDLLVSGVIENASSTVFVHSSGDIIAETKREFSAQGNFIQTITKETEEILNRKTIEIMGLKIPLFFKNIKRANNYNVKSENLTLFGNKIPVKIATETYVFTKETTIKYTVDELEKILLKNIENQVKKFDFLSAEEISKETINTEKGILLKITYKCSENIAKSEQIILSKVN